MMDGTGHESSTQDGQGVEGPPSPLLPLNGRILLWLTGIRIVAVSTLFLASLIIQASTRTILPLGGFYVLVLLTYALSLVHLTLHLRRLSPRLQAVLQLAGDLGIVTGFVYLTGGVYSPFSFLYLVVIGMAAALLRGGGLIFAGLAAVVYGVLVDFLVFGLIPLPPNMVGEQIVVPLSRVLWQLLIHIVGFVLVAILVSYLTESLRRTRQSLEEERERARQFAALTDHVVRSVTAGILASNMEGAVLHLNPAGSGILGIEDPDSVVGRSLEELLPLEGARWGLLLIRARRGQPVRMEGVTPDGKLRLGLTISRLKDEMGSQVGFVVNFQDLAEVERESERQRLQERMAAVGELAARVAHEIKNPLASISGSAQMLSSQVSVDPTAQRLLSIVVEESRRLSNILDGFLAYTRPPQSTRTLCDLVPLLRDLVEILRRSEQRQPNQDIVLELPDELPIFANEHQMQQLAWNLCLNALDAMPDGGRLLISGEVSDGQVILRWCDTGAGMEEDVRLHAFEPFVTTKPGGTGLGLAIVYTVVDDHDGSIDIESEPGKGTTVTVRLPIHVEHEEVT